MPLRDHAKPPYNAPWLVKSVHASWPSPILDSLNEQLPLKYRMAPRNRTGRAALLGPDLIVHNRLALCPIPSDEPDEADYGVYVYDREESDPGHIVAAIELVGTANKDDPERRAAFAARCVALLRQGISVSIIDIVGGMKFNLYADVLDRIGQADPAFTDAPATYAATLRPRARRPKEHRRMECWAYPLAADQPLPTLPVWLNETECVSLDLEATYETTIRKLRLDLNPR